MRPQGPYVEIDIDGAEVSLDLIGWQDAGCAEIMALLTDPDATTTGTRRKPEYFAAGTEGNALRLRQRA